MEQMRVIIRKATGEVYNDTTLPVNEAKGYALRWRTATKHDACFIGWTVTTEKA